MAMGIKNVVVSGNPGVGKSTILNSILGREYFVSDISRGGEGVTREVSKIRHGLNVLVDTPGVSDVNGASANMTKLINAISENVRTKVLFVMTLESGRIKPVDVLLFQLILAHVGDYNKQNVALIINKVSTAVMALEHLVRSEIFKNFGVNNVIMIRDCGNARLVEFNNLVVTRLLKLPFNIDTDIQLLHDGSWNEVARRLITLEKET